MLFINEETIPRSIIPYGEIVLEPILTSIFSLPCLYYFVISPYINARNEAEQSLMLAKVEADIAHKENNDILRSQKEVLKEEVKKATISLAKSKERYALAADGSNDGLWDWDIKKDTLYVSKRWRKIIEFDDNEITFNKWMSIIHHEDRDEFKKKMQDHFSNNSDHFECEYRLKHKNGSFVWVLTRGMAVSDRLGKVVRFAGSQTDISQQKKIQEQLSYDSLHDKLTLLPNRALFNERISQSFARFKRHPDQLFAVLFIDLDNFKQVNDTLGHSAGDELLIRLGFRLKSVCRGEDTVSRWGGDEFTLLMEDVKSLEDVKIYADRLLRTIKKPLLISSQELFVNTSIGIAIISEKYNSAEELLRDADTAMYKAKESGKGKYSIFKDSMHVKTSKRFQLNSQLRRSLEKNEISMYYQPIMDIQKNTLAGFEALMRWNNESLGFIPPDEFISIAEENGFIHELGDFAFDESFSQIKKWKNKYKKDLFVSVNVSQRQIEKPKFVEKIHMYIGKHSMLPENIKIEVTETLLVSQPKLSLSILNDLAKLNIGIAIDDFGTGYSSLSSVHKYPFSILKIDKSFAKNIILDRKSDVMIMSIISIADALGMDIVVEGIEDKDSLKKCINYGSKYAQGYLFSKPMPSSEMENIIPSLINSPQ